MSKMKKDTRKKILIWVSVLVVVCIAILIATFVSYNFKGERVVDPVSHLHTDTDR